ncbi:hypothetical protein FA15DRAFT_724234 [Coprinopsis marcescibilis]|uniref:Alpha-type protein kinase domain-containing protein n=1 Tax=Coprinopsis marcescibilis TaxID=230819 RepID=A0A5C3KUI8_COPMA|nr:hypothetical protein FA15DRAFT_724234 [Coprinopsis marcescibilis]
MNTDLIVRDDFEVTFHQTNTNTYGFNDFDQKKMVRQVFDHLSVLKLLKDKHKSDRVLNLRFMFKPEYFVDRPAFGSQSGVQSMSLASRLISRKNRPKSWAVVSSALSPAAKATSSFNKPASAFQSAIPPSDTAKDPDQLPLYLACRSAFRFSCYMATYNDDGTIKWETNGMDNSSDLSDSVEVSALFEICSKNEGYIGSGFTKIGVHACYKGKEYVLTQPSDPNSSELDVKAVLQAEYGLLCQCDGVKACFDEEINHSTALVPDLYFNFSDSIFSNFIVGEADRPGFSAYHKYFIATLLFPCGPANKPITKFTRNDLMGKADDTLTLALHAFMHYSYVYSQLHFVFCDLQERIGIQAINGHTCLIDPQVHMNEYWDWGPSKIRNLMDEHEKVLLRRGLQRTYQTRGPNGSNNGDLDLPKDCTWITTHNAFLTWQDLTTAFMDGSYEVINESMIDTGCGASIDGRQLEGCQ